MAMARHVTVVKLAQAPKGHLLHLYHNTHTTDVLIATKATLGEMEEEEDPRVIHHHHLRLMVILQILEVTKMQIQK